MQQIRNSSKNLRLLLGIQEYIRNIVPYSHFNTSVDAIDLYTNECSFQRHTAKHQLLNVVSMRHFMEKESDKRINIQIMCIQDVENLLNDLLIKNKDKHIKDIIHDCANHSKIINNHTLKKLFRTYSITGKVDMVEALQKYSLKVNSHLSYRNGDFLHYVAKAHCMRGNSEIGLSILKEAYVKYEVLRGFYRVILRELIFDSVQNRSEASLVIFMKYCLIFSEIWSDHYPLICFWHTCWSSSWFSDQTLSNELLENSEELRNIVRDKATTFSINILREYNEDAVVKLLQFLLKYEMMVEYTKVLQILFSYKLRNKDLRGCTEIIKNCNTLGITLPSSQQGKYIKMLINSTHSEDKPNDKPTKPTNFKLKF